MIPELMCSLRSLISEQQRKDAQADNDLRDLLRSFNFPEAVMNLSPPAKAIPDELWQKIETYQKNSVQIMIARI